jgi:hypothetical protein
MFCIDCGKPNEDSARFCVACGKSIGKSFGLAGTAMAEVHTQGNGSVLQSIRSRISSLASTDTLDGFSLSEFSSEVFKKRIKDEIERRHDTNGGRGIL